MKWHQTANDQIINLDLFESFWIEEILNEYIHKWHVFGKDKDKVHWRMAECQNYSLAEEYLSVIYEKLIHE